MNNKKMTGDEIFVFLNDGSFHWESNEQPSIYLATAILEQLPIIDIRGSGDRLQFTTSRDLRRLELWSLEVLTPDSIQRDGRDFDLWWD